MKPDLEKNVKTCFLWGFRRASLSNMFVFHSRRGSTFLILMIGITVLTILGMSLSYVLRERHYQVVKRGEVLKASCLAEAGIHKALFKLRDVLAQPLCSPRKPKADQVQRINEELLVLLDAERARDWARSFQIEDEKLLGGGEVTVVMELLQVSRIKMASYIDRVEVIPRSLEQYRESKKGGASSSGNSQTFGTSPLGGWVGKLRITSTGQFRSSRCVLEEIKAVKVVDITPPAPDHTLFIEGEDTARIKRGRFVLSNLNLPLQVRDLLFDLGNKVNEVLQLDMSESKAATISNIDKIVKLMTTKADEGDMKESLKLIHQLAKHASDEAIKDTVDNIILNLDPRDWGRVRTNGVLYVYMPFFAADDIINYFADSSYFGHQRPEVGYLFCENRLHDPYLSVYTHYEGYIYKHYQRLNPLVLGPSKKPQPVPPQRYTINTRPDYVRRYPERKAMKKLERLKKEGRRHAHLLVKQERKLVGTEDRPINLSGLWYFTEDLRIEGYYTGRGLIICDKKITIAGDLERLEEADRLSLCALKEFITLSPDKQYYRVQAGIYSREGLRGGREQDLKLFGNLAVWTLERKKMPKFFTCRFDPDLKNHMADNIIASWSRLPLLKRYRGASAAVSLNDSSLEVKSFSHD